MWSVWCIRVRPGYRGRGVSRMSCSTVPSGTRDPRTRERIEGYPVDNQGEKVDLTMAYVGTRKLFEDAGFAKGRGHPLSPRPAGFRAC